VVIGRDKAWERLVLLADGAIGRPGLEGSGAAEMVSSLTW